MVLKLSSFVFIMRKAKQLVPEKADSIKNFIDINNAEYLKANPTTYLDKLTLSHFFFFIFSPTLSFKFVFKRFPNYRFDKIIGYGLFTLGFILMAMYLNLYPWLDTLADSTKVFSKPFSLYHFLVYVS